MSKIYYCETCRKQAISLYADCSLYCHDCQRHMMPIDGQPSRKTTVILAPETDRQLQELMTRYGNATTVIAVAIKKLHQEG